MNTSHILPSRKYQISWHKNIYCQFMLLGKSRNIFEDDTWHYNDMPNELTNFGYSVLPWGFLLLLLFFPKSRQLAIGQLNPFMSSIFAASMMHMYCRSNNYFSEIVWGECNGNKYINPDHRQARA